jgi:hypothetical protein
MMTNNTHQVAAFDSIVGDETSRQILEGANLLPSTWNLPDLEVERILGSGLRIWIDSGLIGKNWPAYANRSANPKLVRIARDFIEAVSFQPDEKFATILHEIGHIVNPEPNRQKRYGDMTESERMAFYLPAISPSNDPDWISEFYADDYVRYCGLTQALESGLKRLLADYPEFFETQVTISRLARIASGCEHDLNLITPPY